MPVSSNASATNSTNSTAGNKQHYSQREKQLRDASAKFLAAHNRFVDNDDEPNPTERYWDSLDNLIGVFSNGQGTPTSCVPLAGAVNKLRIEYANYDNRENIGKLYPHKEFWKAIELFAVALSAGPAKEPFFTPLESMASLRGTRWGEPGGCTAEQIARIYELFDHNGNPNIKAVYDELETPGSVLNGNWVDPRLRRWRENEEANRVLVEQELSDAADEIEENQHTPPPAKETAYELYQQGLSPKQAAATLTWPFAEVMEKWEQFDMAKRTKAAQGAPGASGSGMDRGQGAGADGANATGIANTGFQSSSDLEATIRQLSNEGQEPSKIADTMKIGLSEVNRVLKGK